MVFDPEDLSEKYTETAASDAEGDEAIVKMIGESLAKDNFRLLFQPVVSLQGDTRENYAVLLRMLDGQGNEIRPLQFLKHAVASGQMVDIDRWVIKHVIETLAAERGQGRKVNFFITLSSTALEDDGLLLWICGTTRRKGPGSPSRSRTKSVATSWKIRCQIAIDQFGTNPKAEILLKHLKADYVKLDQSLMADLAVRQEKQDNLNQLTSLALSYEVKTIATGVEDANSLAILWTVGVNYTQGYFLPRVSLPRERFWDIPVPKIDSPTRQPLLPRPSCAHHDSVPHIAAKLLVRNSVMMTTMTLRRVGCAICMPYVTPYRS
ncbi:MAG: EAL domain-containing protein [Candidatus Sedimenticola endophacoides]